MLFDIRRFSRIVFILITLASVLVVQGCFHNDNGGGTPPGDPTGYYTGTISADGYSDSSIYGIYHNKRLILVSLNSSAKYLYDISLTINGSSISGSSINYVDGVKPVDATATSNVTGSINPGAEIKGNLNGTGMGKGSFTLTFHTSVNGQVANMANIERIGGDNWTGKLPGGSNNHQMNFQFNGTISEETLPLGGTFDGCGIYGPAGTISVIPETPIYAIANLTTDFNCITTGLQDKFHSGYILPTNVNNTQILFMFMNGEYAGYALYN